MNSLIKVFAAICLFPVMAHALDYGGDVSGGGYIIVCKDPETGVESSELLDYFEARYTMRDFKLMDISKVAGKTPFEKARNLVHSRLHNWTPQLTKKIVDILTAFEKEEMNFIKRGVITDIDDAQTSIDPDSNCYKLQIAVQFKTPAPRQYRVLVDSKAWDQINEQTKIGLLIHEALYTVALEQGHTNSNKVRAINATLAMEDYDDYVEGNILKLLNYAKIDSCMEMPIDFYNEDGLDQTLFIPVKISSYKVNDHVRSGNLCENFTTTLSG
jgi:hypothetical protein